MPKCFARFTWPNFVKAAQFPFPVNLAGRGFGARYIAAGREKVRQRHIVLEKKTRIQFDLVLDQLIAERTPI